MVEYNTTNLSLFSGNLIESFFLFSGHCVKRVRIRGYSDSYFTVLKIRDSENTSDRKYESEKTFVMAYFT